jgi:uncharacterized protein (TIGR03435 family)
MRTTAVLLVFAMTGGVSAAARQAASPQPRFEAAAIHPSSADTSTRVEILGGRFVAAGVTVWDLVKLAYQVRNDDQLAGGAGWVRSARYDIVATGAPSGLATTQGAVAPPSGPALAEAQVKLRSLLAERFGLTLHHEQRESAAYALSPTASTPGPRLRSALPCTRGTVAAGATAACGGFSLAGPGIEAKAVDMAAFVSLLSNLPAVGRSVEDRTGLRGLYDIGLTYTRPRPTDAADGSDGPSIFTALQEQLGLTLEPIRLAVDVVVIDRVTPPTPN